MKHQQDEEQNDSGYAFHGNVQTGAIGTAATATVGAIGEHSRGFVSVSHDPEADRLLVQLLALVDELRKTLDDHRQTVGEDYTTIRDNIDDLQEALELKKPSNRIRSRLKVLHQLVMPFTALADLVAKIVELVPRSQG